MPARHRRRARRAGNGQAAYTASSVNLRSGPGTGYGIILTLPPGAFVAVHYCQPSWCSVTAAGYDGWVAASYIGGGGVVVRTTRRLILTTRGPTSTKPIRRRPCMSLPGPMFIRGPMPTRIPIGRGPVTISISGIAAGSGDALPIAADGGHRREALTAAHPMFASTGAGSARPVGSMPERPFAAKVGSTILVRCRRAMMEHAPPPTSPAWLPARYGSCRDRQSARTRPFPQDSATSAAMVAGLDRSGRPASARPCL